MSALDGGGGVAVRCREEENSRKSKERKVGKFNVSGKSLVLRGVVVIRHELYRTPNCWRLHEA